MIKFDLSSVGRAVPRRGAAARLAQELPAAIRAIAEPSFPSRAGLDPELLAKEIVETRGYPVRQFGSAQTTTPGIDPGVDAAVSKTYDASRPLSDYITEAKTFLSAFFTPAPNTPDDFKDSVVAARESLRKADSVAAHDIASMLNPLEEDMIGGPEDIPKRASMVVKQFLIDDTLAQMKRDGVSQINGIPKERWEQANEELLWRINTDVGAQRAASNIRGGLNEIFNDMVARGWIARDRYLESYSPVEKINTIIGSMARVLGEDEGALRAKILSTQKSRGKAEGESVREGNLISTLHRVRSEYLHKVAQQEFFRELLNSPWNMTAQFEEGATLPRGVAAYYPGPGMIGYLHEGRDRDIISGVLDGLDSDGQVTAGRYIFPEGLVRALKNVEPPPAPTGVSRTLYDLSRGLARNVTVYNVANTQLNRFSDAIVALLGMPGEKAQPLGFIKFYRPAMKLAKAFVEGQPAKIVINGQEVDVTDLLVRQGVATSTQFSDLSDRPVSAQLLKVLPEEEMANESWLQKWVTNPLQESREKVELTPRIAAGLEALERTGSIDEFGRVARNITLNYNEGAPELSEQVLLRFMAPFIKFMGLSSRRVFELATTKGSRGRSALAIAAVPTMFMMWNYQNEAYREVENSLSEMERDQLHFIVPSSQWGTPRRDMNGNPVVLRVRWFVTEEVAKMAGLGNLPSRFVRMAEGRDTPIQFVQKTPEIIMKNISDMASIPSMTQEVLTGKSRFGQELTIPERVARLMPSLKIPQAAISAYQNTPGDTEQKMTEAAFSLAAPMLGVSRVENPRTRGGRSIDADFADAKRNLIDQQRKIATLRNKGRSGEIAAALEEERRLRQEFLRIREIYLATREKTGGPDSYRTEESKRAMEEELRKRQGIPE